jgi:PIN domain nuclease of toxin-antitoxin system
MKSRGYLFDTHALLFWSTKSAVSTEFIHFFDEQNEQGTLYISAISFWEIALLAQKGRLALSDVHAWKDELLAYTNLRLIEPSVMEMIQSTQLPLHHKDPFDRLLIAQALHQGLTFVTQDQAIQHYEVPQLWL